jgi:hypothetical protein
MNITEMKMQMLTCDIPTNGTHIIDRKNRFMSLTSWSKLRIFK